MPIDRAAGLQRQVHDLDDLLAEDLAERAAEDGEVLREHAHRPAVDGAVAGDDAVAVRARAPASAEVVGAVPGQLVELDERALVEQRLDPLAGGLLALGVLLLDRAAPSPRARASSLRRRRSASLPAVVWMFGAGRPRRVDLRCLHHARERSGGPRQRPSAGAARVTPAAPRHDAFRVDPGTTRSLIHAVA